MFADGPGTDRSIAKNAAVDENVGAPGRAKHGLVQLWSIGFGLLLPLKGTYEAN